MMLLDKTWYELWLIFIAGYQGEKKVVSREYTRTQEDAKIQRTYKNTQPFFSPSGPKRISKWSGPFLNFWWPRGEITLVEKTSFAAFFWPLFAAVLAPSNSDGSK